MPVSKLLPCPFCGNENPVFVRVGTRRQSCIVDCEECGARHESGDEEWNSGASWNMRNGKPWGHPTTHPDRFTDKMPEEVGGC